MRNVVIPFAVPAVCAAAALGGCGGASKDAAGQIQDQIRASIALKDKATCTQAFTDNGLMADYSESSAQAARKDCANEVGQKQHQDQANQIKISAIKVTGTTATANAQLGKRAATYSLVKQGGSWKVDGIREAGASSASASTTSTPSATASTSSATNRLALEIAARQYNAGAHRFVSRVQADAGARNLGAVKADAADYRDVVFNFDATVRKITPTDSARSEYNALLDASRTTIADLDAIGSAPTAAEFGRLFRSHVAPDTQRLISAEAQLYDAL